DASVPREQAAAMPRGKYPASLRSYTQQEPGTAGHHAPPGHSATAPRPMAPAVGRPRCRGGRVGARLPRARQGGQVPGRRRGPEVLEGKSPHRRMSRMESIPSEIRTPRVLLRAWRSEDLDPFAMMSADAEVMRYFPATLSRAESAAMIDRIQA